MANRVWEVLNSKLVVLLLGFLLTGIVGTLLSDRVQDAAWHRRSAFEAERRAFEWERDKTFELLGHRLDRGLASLQEISRTMNRRFFLMERVFNILANGTRVGSSLWSEYMDAVSSWNINLKYYEEDLKRLADTSFAWELNDNKTDDYSTDGCPAEPYSIHSKFFCAHRDINQLRRCDSCNRDTLASHARALINKLNFQSDAFIARAGDVFLDQSAQLERFQFLPDSTPPSTR